MFRNSRRQDCYLSRSGREGKKDLVLVPVLRANNFPPVRGQGKRAEPTTNSSSPEKRGSNDDQASKSADVVGQSGGKKSVSVKRPSSKQARLTDPVGGGGRKRAKQGKRIRDVFDELDDEDDDEDNRNFLDEGEGEFEGETSATN